MATLGVLPLAWLVSQGHHGVVWLWLAYGGYLLIRLVTLLLRARTDTWMRLGA